MAEIIYDVSINAPVENVYRALTEREPMERWWTECFLKPEVGSDAVFYFRLAGGYKRMRVEKLVPDKLVEWKCLDHYYEGMTDWVGTTIRFTMSKNAQNGTDLHFEHLNWKDKGGCYEQCVTGWGHFIRTSLKEYVETGIGQPYGDNAATAERREKSIHQGARA